MNPSFDVYDVKVTLLVIESNFLKNCCVGAVSTIILLHPSKSVSCVIDVFFSLPAIFGTLHNSSLRTVKLLLIVRKESPIH